MHWFLKGFADKSYIIIFIFLPHILVSTSSVYMKQDILKIKIEWSLTSDHLIDPNLDHSSDY